MEIIKYIRKALDHHQTRDLDQLHGNPQRDSGDDKQIGNPIEYILQINLAKQTIQKIGDEHLNQEHQHTNINKKLEMTLKKLP